MQSYPQQHNPEMSRISPFRDSKDTRHQWTLFSIMTKWSWAGMWDKKPTREPNCHQVLLGVGSLCPHALPCVLSAWCPSRHLVLTGRLPNSL